MIHGWGCSSSEKAVARVFVTKASFRSFLNDSKCEFFSKGNLKSWPQCMKQSSTPNLGVLGARIRDVIYCAKFVANECAKACALLSRLQQVGSKLVPKTHRLRTCCFASVAASVKWYTWPDQHPPPSLLKH